MTFDLISRHAGTFPASTLTPSSRDLSPPSESHLLHGVSLRPPNWENEIQAQRTPQLLAVDSSRALLVPGVVTCVIKGGFVGIVAAQRHQAMQARGLLNASWATPVPSEATTLPSQGGQMPAPAAPSPQIQYSWNNIETDLSPDWAVAWHHEHQLTIWTSTQRAEALKAELAALLKVDAQHIHVIPHGGTKQAGFDTAVEAALLAWDLHRPVRVQAEYVPAPLAVTIYPQALSDNGKEPYQPQWAINAVSPNRPSIAASLSGLIDSLPRGLSLQTDYVSQPAAALQQYTVADPYSYTAATVFAQESYFDEYCKAQELDPLQTRIDKIKSERGQELLKQVARQADWDQSWAPADPTKQSGRGIAYSHVIDHDHNPPKETWSAWAVELNVDPQSGELSVSKLTVGHEATNLDHAAAFSPTQEALKDELGRWSQLLLGQAKQGGSKADPSAASSAVTMPEVNLVNQSHALDQPIAWSPGAELPAAAAIANAIYNATGLRIRQTPFTLPTLLLDNETNKKPKKFRRKTWLGGLAAAVTGAFVVASPWRTSIPPVANIDTSIFSVGAIERGRLVALTGDCMVCHTQEGGKTNAGGLGLETPFGTVFTTNITPDKETGIGTWSYKAFERAMREGIHQDGTHLYPAFPYTSYAKISDEDLQSLYAYLMTQPAVSQPNVETRLSFPMNVRPLLAGWNTLFHRDRQAYTPDDAQSTLWNRGAYLVNSSGHCTACHTPRNALGAEKSGKNQFLAGGFADNWEAPALTGLSSAPIPWTEAELFQYLRTGYSPLHGTAAGPMGPVVTGLAQLPEGDVRAMAHYLASLNPEAKASEATHGALAASLEARSQADADTMLMPGENLFNGACAVCHDSRSGPVLFGARPSLALNTNLHSDQPDNVIQVLMHGISRPALANLSTMPAFKHSMNDTQLESLVHYMRKRFAPDKAAWNNVSGKIATIRKQAGHP